MVLQSPHLLKDWIPQIQCSSNLFSFPLFIYLFIYVFIIFFQLLYLELGFLSVAYLTVANLAQFEISGRCLVLVRSQNLVKFLSLC